MVADVFYTKQRDQGYAFRLLDLNVWAPVTDSLLHDWAQLSAIAFAPAEPLSIRRVTDDAMRTSSYDIYGLPVDIQVLDFGGVFIGIAPPAIVNS